jgi:hypothetical protein
VSFPLEQALGDTADFTPAGTFTARATFDKGGSVRPRLRHVCAPCACVRVHLTRRVAAQGAVRFSHLKLTRDPVSEADGCAHSSGRRGGRCP